MLVYQTDYTGDGRFVGTIDADPDPMRKGEWLIPAGAVTVEPPLVEYPAYARWAGEAWEVYTPPEPEPDPEFPAQEPTVEDYRAAIQSLIDGKAQEKQYDSGATLASYVNSTIPQWAAEATAFVAWRDQVWAYALAELDKVQNGQREQPSVEAFLAELPVFEWPE
ncbi:hypothetical protein H7Q97_18240 [Ochrobactrum sp. CM-21-5]|nr:hypothetical protein [Ochrobactrum sp. CM-21-5]MBC2887323.1 hypothetical protein [Ochrobactrum sp. CM-21-5]